MLNFKHDISIIRDRLLEKGFVFNNPDESLIPPDSLLKEKIEQFEKNIGNIPDALIAFYQYVGSVDFTGHHLEWSGCEYPDPIVIYSIDAGIDELEEYLTLDDPKEEYWGSETGIFRMPIAPDYYHKEDVSGGMWYGIEIPNSKNDPPLLEEWHGTTFTEYLKTCFKWGGFPGLERCKKNNWPVDELTKGLFNR